MAQQNDDQTFATPNPGSPTGAEETKSSEFVLGSIFNSTGTTASDRLTSALEGLQKQSIQLNQFNPPEILERPLTVQKVRALAHSLATYKTLYPTAIPLNRYNYIHKDAVWSILDHFYSIELPFDPDDPCWEKLTDEVYLSHLEKALVTDMPVGPNTIDTFTQTLRDLRFNFNPLNYLESIQPYTSKIRDVMSQMQMLKIAFSAEAEANLVKEMVDNFPKTKVGNKFKNELIKGVFPKKLLDLLHRIPTLAGKINTTVRSLEELGFVIYFPSGNKKKHNLEKEVNNNKKRQKTEENPKKSKYSSETAHDICESCGNRGHTFENCNFRKKEPPHPDCNLDKAIPWLQSSNYKAWHDKHNLQALSWAVDSLDGSFKGKPRSDFDVNHKHPTKKPRDKNSKDYQSKKNKYDHKQSESFMLTVEQNHNIITNTNNEYMYSLIPSYAVFCCSSLPVETILDTGALQSNYIHEDVAKWLQSKGANTCKCSHRVKTVAGNIDINECMSVELILTNEMTSEKINLKINARVLNSDYDIIIGLPTIIQYNLLEFFKYKFKAVNVLLPPYCNNNSNTTFSGTAPSDADRAPQEPDLRTPSTSCTISKEMGSENDVQTLPKSRFIDYEPDANDIIDEYPEVLHFTSTDSLQQNIETTQLNLNDENNSVCLEKINELLNNFKDVISSTIGAPTTELPPMKLHVNEKNWDINLNSLPPRPQSAKAQEEIQTQITKLLENQIVPCTEPRYSQVHLVKQADKIRMVIDYRRLNNETTSITWPMTRVDEALQRIGTHKPKYFAKLDMTSGYHQISMDPDSQKYTAFITYLGLFKWLCIPFGLKGAPAHFQKVMATIVLQGLLYKILEVYLDDILIYATTEQELVNRVQLVLERFRKYKLKLNPKKCVFGVTEVTFLGHTITKDGITFSQHKREHAVNFLKPNTQKDMKKFLGVATYFCTHIRNYTEIARPLRDLINPYNPRLKIKWTLELEKAFSDVKESINNIPTLFFVKEALPIYLKTDASDYGIGGYLYQLENEVELPIAFLSKSLTPQERRWATPDKEAYAIIYALLKLRYLLRDIHFTLLTDHKNLTYINLDFKSRVKRWKLIIQEYDFDIKHVPGRDNVAADAFSRLIPIDCPSSNDLIAVDELNLLDEIDIPDERYEQIASVHNSIEGHWGLEKTIYRLIHAKNLKWRKMRQHTKKFIQLCPCCQKMSMLKPQITAKRYIRSVYTPWQKINIDTIGPLPIDEDMNKYIIVIIDCFSRFVLLYPSKDASAKSAAYAVLNCIGLFGSPYEILSDNGKQYVNDIIKELMYFIGTEQTLTCAYSHEENAIVERANKEVMRHLRNLMFHQLVLTRWSKSLPLVQRLFNADIKEAIGVSPAQIVFGNINQLDKSILLPEREDPSNESNSPISISSWIKELVESQKAIISAAIDTQFLKNQQHLSENDNKEITTFPINSYVLVDYPESPPTKLHSPKSGPYQVINNIGSIYTLRNLATNKISDYHVSRLVEFFYDSNRTNPTTIANIDNQLATVEAILDMNGNPHGSRKDLTFKVRWSGRDDRDDSWETYSNLRHNAILHEFLIANKLRKLIPK